MGKRFKVGDKVTFRAMLFGERDRPGVYFRFEREEYLPAWHGVVEKTGPLQGADGYGQQIAWVRASPRGLCKVPLDDLAQDRS